MGRAKAPELPYQPHLLLANMNRLAAFYGSSVGSDEKAAIFGDALQGTRVQSRPDLRRRRAVETVTPTSRASSAVVDNPNGRPRGTNPGTFTRPAAATSESVPDGYRWLKARWSGRQNPHRRFESARRLQEAAMSAPFGQSLLSRRGPPWQAGRQRLSWVDLRPIIRGQQGLCSAAPCCLPHTDCARVGRLLVSIGSASFQRARPLVRGAPRHPPIRSGALRHPQDGCTILHNDKISQDKRLGLVRRREAREPRERRVRL